MSHPAIQCGRPSVGPSTGHSRPVLAISSLHKRISSLHYATSLARLKQLHPTSPTCRHRLGAATITPKAQAQNQQTSNSLPISPVAMVDQAAAGASAALAEGILRQQIDFLLPINEKERSFTATEPDDYPCSLQKEFDVACALTTSLLQRIVGDPTVDIAARRLDDGGVEGEPCAVLYPRETKEIAALVYPTAERLKQIKDLAKETSRPLLLINPQWREAGQVISDFGIGPWKAAALKFLDEFKPTYFLKEKRIGSPGTVNMATQSRFASGGVVRVLRRWGVNKNYYDVYAMAADGSSQLLHSGPSEPTYAEIDAMINEGRKKKMEIFSIAQRVTSVMGSEDDIAPAGGSNDGAGQEGSENSLGAMAMEGAMSEGDVDSMDKASLQRRLSAMGLPTSGKLSSLRERMKEAMAEKR